MKNTVTQKKIARDLELHFEPLYLDPQIFVNKKKNAIVIIYCI